MTAQGAQAILVLEVPASFRNGKQIAEMSVAHRLPTMFPGGLASAGGVVTFGTSIFDAWHRM